MTIFNLLNTTREQDGTDERDDDMFFEDRKREGYRKA